MGVDALDALVSIHDVTPETLDRVDAIIARLPGPCRENLVLLVCPGFDWHASDIDVLKRWQSEGYLLAGHGWSHEAHHIRGVYHTLHSLLISRNAAEHLSLTAEEIVELMGRNHDWFAARGLAPPDYYVPPAWALGPVTPGQLASLPFRYIEVTSGLMDVQLRAHKLLPLQGFEADTRLRAVSLHVNNALNAAVARILAPLRIAIHPYDPEFLVSEALWQACARVTRGVHYNTLFDHPG